MNIETEENVALIKACGYRVFMRNPENTHCFYTDGERIGYAQWSNGDAHVSTVHRPSPSGGGGFYIADSITPDTLLDGLRITAPAWASGPDRASVRKYKNLGEFLEDNWHAQHNEV